MNKYDLVLVCGKVVGGHEIQLMAILRDLCEIRGDLLVLCQTPVTHAYFSSLPCEVQLVEFGVAGKVWRQWQGAPFIARQLAKFFTRAKNIFISGGTIEACLGTARAAKIAKPGTQVTAYVPMYIDRSLSHGVIGSIYDFLVDRMGRVIDNYVTINRVQALMLQRHYRRPVKVVENSIQPVFPPTVSKGKRLVFLGRFDDGQKNLIEMIGMLDREDNPYRELVLIGDGPDKDAIVACAAKTNFVKVQLLNWMSTIEVDEFLGSDDSLIMNSRWEGEPLVVREFTARGLPCIVRDIDGMRGVTKRTLRFVDSASLIAILKMLDASACQKNFVRANRVKQSRRMSIIESCFVV